MAAIWTATMTVGSYYGYGYYPGGGIYGSNLGTLSTTAFTPYSNATILELFWDAAGNLDFKVAGNRSGGWVSCKLGPFYYQYSDFTRTYDGTNTNFRVTTPHNPFRYFSPAPKTPVVVTFFDNSMTAGYGVHVYGSAAAYGLTWSSESRYTNVLAQGVVNVAANSNSGPIAAAGVGTSGAFVLLNSPGLSMVSVTYTTTTNSFTIYNGNSAANDIEYLAVRT